MASIQIHEHPFLECAPYRLRVDLTLQERIIQINARKVYQIGNRMDWGETDAWRQEGIRELPHPPIGYCYFFNSIRHRVELQPMGGVSYRHVRRSVDDAIDIEHHPGAQVRLHMIQKLAQAEKRDMQEAIAQTYVQVAEKKKFSSKATKKKALLNTK